MSGRITPATTCTRPDPDGTLSGRDGLDGRRKVCFRHDDGLRLALLDERFFATGQRPPGDRGSAV
jgi:hypothetical protein